MKKLLFIPLFCTIGMSANAQTRLSHSTQDNITSGNSAACTTTGIVSDNYYFRRFALDDFGITDTAFIIKIETGVESTTGGPYNIRGSAYELNGPLMFGNLSLISVDTVPIYPDSSAYEIDIPLYGYALPGDTLVAEVYTPDDIAVGFFMGSNAYFENDESFLAAPSCGITEPETFTNIGFPSTHLVLHMWVNQRPTYGDFMVTGWKDNDLNFSKADFAAPFADNDGDTISAAIIKTLPAYGILNLFGTPVNVLDTVWAYEMDSLIYTPDPAYAGVDVFAVQARDNHHWANSLNVVSLNVMDWAVGIEEESEISLNLYPNPANEEITIETESNIIDLKIVDLNGKIIFQSTDNTNQVDISSFDTGVYMVLVETEEGIVRSQFVKE